jgi:hypothetical protein
LIRHFGSIQHFCYFDKIWVWIMLLVKIQTHYKRLNVKLLPNLKALLLDFRSPSWTSVASLIWQKYSPMKYAWSKYKPKTKNRTQTSSKHTELWSKSQFFSFFELRRHVEKLWKEISFLFQILKLILTENVAKCSIFFNWLRKNSRGRPICFSLQKSKERKIFLFNVWDNWNVIRKVIFF